MELSREDIKRVCEIARVEMEKRIAEYPSDNKNIKKEKGIIAEITYCGSYNNLIMVSFLNRWFYTCAGSVMKPGQVVHMILVVNVTHDRRVIRVQDIHKPIWIVKIKNITDECTLCKQTVFDEKIVIMNDTTLEEY